MKVSRKDFELFLEDWNNGKHPHERLGQAFINKFYDKIREDMPGFDGMPHCHPELFHTRNTDLAIYIIEAKYIEQKSGD